MTKEELYKIQNNAAIDLIVKMDVQMGYRRSTPLSSERVVAYWDVIKQQYDETLAKAMNDYYKSNGIVPFAEM